MICTLSDTHWQRVSKISALRPSELIWKDWHKCAHEYSNFYYYYYYYSYYSYYYYCCYYYYYYY